MKHRIFLILLFFCITAQLFSQNNLFSGEKVLFVSGNNPPYEYINKQGEIEGYNIDLVKEIMKRINSDYEIKLFNWNDALEFAKKNENAVVIGMIYSKDAAKGFRFSTPYEYVSLSIVSNKDNHYQSLRELKDKSVIVIKGSYEEHLLTESLKRFNINPITVNKAQEGIEMIYHNIGDAFIVNSIMGIYSIREREYDLNINEMKDQPSLKYCMASSVRNDSLIMQINNSLAQIKADGTYYTIYDKWMNNIKDEDIIPEWLKYTLAIGSIILIGAIVISVVFQRQVKKSTSKISEQNDNISKINEQLSLIINNTNSGYVYLSPNLDIIWESVSQSKAFNNNNIYKKIGMKCYSDVDDNEMCRKCPVRRSIFSGMIEKSENKLETTPIEQTAIPITGSDGLAKGIILKIEDISEQKRTRDELIRAKEKAEKSDKLKSAFLANVTNEFRTPLNSIMGFSALLVDEDNKKDRQKYLEIIQMNTDSLVNLIDDVLDLSSIEAGYVNIENLEFNINDLFTSIQSNLNKSFMINGNVEFKLEQPCDILFVNLDFRRTEQILLNYLTNASKYTDEGSITLGYMVTDDELRFYVKDTGCGIPKEKIGLLFRSFQKLNSYKQGIGLGLAIAKIIAEAMGGKVEVDSVLNQGSTFWLVFPKSVISEIESQAI